MSFGIQLDQSMDAMEETRYLKRHAHLIKRLTRELHFTRNEIECTLLIYYKLQKKGVPNQPAITKTQFKDVLHNGLDITDTDLCDLLTSVLERSATIYFPLETWVRVMSLFLRGTLEEQIDYCFSVYNVLHTNMLTRDQMVSLLSHCIIGEGDNEDEVKDLVELLAKRLDLDRDGSVSFNDFKETVKRQPLLLEAFGQCLPTRLAVHTFLTTFTHKNGKL